MQEELGKQKSVPVIVLDDRRHYVDSIQRILELNGIDSSGATDVDQALELMRETQYELLICDMMMPSGERFSDLETQGGRRTGLFFCHYARLHFPETKIVLLTSAEVRGFDRDFLFEMDIEILQKGMINQLEVVEHAKGMLAQSKPQDFSDVFEIKPGAFGLKVDLKKAFRLIRDIRTKKQSISKAEVRRRWSDERQQPDQS